MFCMMMAPSVRAFLPSKFQTSVLVGPSSTILGGASVRHANGENVSGWTAYLATCVK